MSSVTDPLRLNDNKLFKVLKESLPKNEKETLNILEIRDDILYVWNPDKCCIFTLNVTATRGKPGEIVPYQTLQPTDPPIFEITNLLINEIATQIALWGNLGIVLVELPRRWGKDNAFQGGKEVVTCLNHNLNGFSSHLAATEVRRVRWHPGSAADSHLLVLTSENTFQLYDCEMGETPKLMRTWKIGPTPSGSPSKTFPNIEALGETAVDFDFSTPSVESNGCVNELHQWNKIEWPILVLHGNGEVIVVHGNMLSKNFSKPEIVGPLTMHPAATDNYGVESCSIMCIQTTPPLVVIASCSGKIYHALYLCEDFENKDSYQEKDSLHQFGSTFNLHPTRDALFVFEIVEIELGLLFNENDKKYSCPIQLHRDKGNKSRYFCSHNAGIHMVTLPIVSQLEEYVSSNEENSDLYLPSTLNPSSSQYLVCTRTKHTRKEEATPILGFGLLQQPCPVLISLLHTGIIVDLSIVDLDYLPKIGLPEPIVSPSKKVIREPFDSHIRDILKHDSTSQPITKLGVKSKMSGKEYLELLYRATHVFRTHYFIKHDKVRNDIGKKIRTLKELKNHQLNELNLMMETKKELTSKAGHLAERYEDIKDKQVELAKRAEEVLRSVNYKELSSAERVEGLQLKELDNKIQDFVVRLCQLKKKALDQASHIENNKKKEKKNELVLSNKQDEAIKSNIGQMAKDIGKMIAQVKTLEEDLEI